MSADDRSVVVTGLGATTPLGGDVASTWSGMLAGRSGVQALTEDWAKDLPSRIAGVAAADPAEAVGRVQARRMDRCEQFALVAAREAWADAGQPEVSPERLGVSVTSGIGGIGSTLAAYDILKEKGWQRISPFTVPMLMPNGSAGYISIELGAQAGAAFDGQRVRVRGGGDRLRHRHDQVRARGHRGRRGHRSRDHGPEPGRVRRDAGAVRPQ